MYLTPSEIRQTQVSLYCCCVPQHNIKLHNLTSFEQCSRRLLNGWLDGEIGEYVELDVPSILVNTAAASYQYCYSRFIMGV